VDLKIYLEIPHSLNIGVRGHFLPQSHLLIWQQPAATSAIGSVIPKCGFLATKDFFFHAHPQIQIQRFELRL
jgi:hypothetical protein